MGSLNQFHLVLTTIQVKQSQITFIPRLSTFPYLHALFVKSVSTNSIKTEARELISIMQTQPYYGHNAHHSAIAATSL